MLLESVEVIHITDKAVLIEFDYGDEPEEDVNRFWIPLSLIDGWDEDTELNDIIDLEVASWFCRQNEGLMECIENSG